MSESSPPATLSDGTQSTDGKCTSQHDGNVCQLRTFAGQHIGPHYFTDGETAKVWLDVEMIDGTKAKMVWRR